MTASGDEQIVLRPSPDDKNCDGREINRRYRLAKVSAQDERLGLIALDDGRESSPESAKFSDGTTSIDEDGTPSKENLQNAIGTALTRPYSLDQTLSIPSSADDSREASPVKALSLDFGNWVRPVDDSSEPNKPMTIHQLHFGDSNDSGSSDEGYEPSDEPTDVNNIENLEDIVESSHYSEDQDSEFAKDHSLGLEDDVPPYTNSSRSEDSEEEVSIHTSLLC